MSDYQSITITSRERFEAFSAAIATTVWLGVIAIATFSVV
jgi:hypothetical protein